MYALVTDGVIRSVGALPSAARRTDTGQWVLPPRGRWTDDLAAACGYTPVVDTPRPADTATTTHERTVELVDGKPTLVWTPRDKTTDEQTSERRETRYATLLERVQTAQQGNRDFLALTSVTTAQAVSQVKDLTRQNNALMQLVLRLAGRVAAMDAPD